MPIVLQPPLGARTLTAPALSAVLSTTTFCTFMLKFSPIWLRWGQAKEDGNFQITLASGTYQSGSSPGPNGFPNAEEQTVEVLSGELTQLRFSLIQEFGSHETNIGSGSFRVERPADSVSETLSVIGSQARQVSLHVDNVLIGDVEFSSCMVCISAQPIVQRLGRHAN